MLLLYYKASFTWSKLLIYIDKLVLQYVFTRQGSQVRTLYHHQLNQALTTPSGQILRLGSAKGIKVFALLTRNSFEVVWSASVMITQVDQLFT